MCVVAVDGKHHQFTVQCLELGHHLGKGHELGRAHRREVRRMAE
jgi:hypothetical protein